MLTFCRQTAAWIEDPRGVSADQPEVEVVPDLDKEELIVSVQVATDQKGSSV